MDLNQTIFVMELDTENESHNIRNIIYNMQRWQPVMYGKIGEINYQGLIWKVATWVEDILFLLTFLDNHINKKEKQGVASYKMIGSTNLSEHTNDDTQCWNDPNINHFVLDEYPDHSWSLQMVKDQDMSVHMKKTSESWYKQKWWWVDECHMNKLHVA